MEYIIRTVSYLFENPYSSKNLWKILEFWSDLK